MSDGGQSRARRFLPEVLCALALLVPALLLLRQLRAAGWSCGAVMNIWDVRMVNYMLEWGYQYLFGSVEWGTGSIWSPPFFFPEPNVLAYTDSYFSAYPFYFPARALGLNPHQALIFFHVAQLALTPLVTYGCARWLGLSRAAAFVCAFTFGWGWARYFQLMHIQFSAGYVIPLFFTFLHQFLKTTDPKWMVGLLWTLLFAFYFAVYIAYFVCLLAALTVALATLWSPRSVKPFLTESLRRLSAVPRKQWALFAALAVAPVLLMAIGAHHYRQASKVLGGGDPQDAITYWASIWSWLHPDSGNLIWGRLSELPPKEPVAPWEKNTFIGFASLAACLVTPVWLWRDRRKPEALARWSLPAPALVAAAFTVLLVVIFISEWPPRLDFLELPLKAARRYLPGFSALRASGRVCLLLSFLAALVAAVLIDRIRKGEHPAAARYTFAAALGLVVFLENVPPTPPIADRCGEDRPWNALQEPLCKLSEERGGATLAFLPAEWISFERIFSGVPMMTMALNCGVASINGYTGYPAPSIAPIYKADPKQFPCAAFASVADAATAKGKGLLVYVEKTGPLGAPQYPIDEVTKCLASCAAPEVIPVVAGDREGAAIYVDPSRRCSTNPG